jgi:hypothetical protein
VQMGLIARRSLEDRRLDLDETLGLKISTQSGKNARSRNQARSTVGVTIARPERG